MGWGELLLLLHTADSGWVFNDVSYRVRYHGWLVGLRGKLSGVATHGWYRSIWEKAPCLINLYVMAIEITIEYSYYSTKRITPGIQQIRRTHCERGTPSPKDEFIATYSKGRWNCRCVDLSRKYFNLQMNSLLDKGAKSIRIRVFEFTSPITIEYSYYSTKRITPGIQQIRRTHCERGTPSPKDEFIATYSKGRWNCRCVDLSRKYFNLQMNSLLDKGAKSIRIRVFEFTSPAIDTGYSQSRKHGWDRSRGSRANTDACLTLTKFTNRPGNIIVSGLPPPSMILSMMICLRSEDKGFPGI